MDQMERWYLLDEKKEVLVKVKQDLVLELFVVLFLVVHQAVHQAIMVLETQTVVKQEIHTGKII